MFALLRFRTEVFNTDLLSDQDSKAVHKRTDVIKLKGTVQACVIELRTSSDSKVEFKSQLTCQFILILFIQNISPVLTG